MPSSLEQGRVQLSGLVTHIRDEFPELQFTGATLDDAGEDHVVVVLDSEWVFRFPRGPEVASYAAGERRLLEILADVSRLATPVYELVSAAGDFGGYRMIKGRQLTDLVFASLARPVQVRVVEEIADFLNVLHRLPADLLAAAHSPPRRGHSPGWFYAARWQTRRETYAGVLSPGAMERLDTFYQDLPGVVDEAPQTFTHNDFTGDHILLAPSGDRLAGVIDFTDAGSGDPAFDFAFLWTYGEWATRHAALRYSGGSRPADILVRSRWWFARYRIDQAWWELDGSGDHDVSEISDELERDAI